MKACKRRCCLVRSLSATGVPFFSISNSGIYFRPRAPYRDRGFVSSGYGAAKMFFHFVTGR